MMIKNKLVNESKQRSPWFWIPSLYFAEGIPYVVVMTVSVIMFKKLGISNADITLYTGWLYLPWVIKPLWSPMVDLLKTKRWWIIIMQLIIGAALGGIALAIPLPVFFKATLIFMWLLAFSSATHDIAADGFYMLGLNEHQQAYFVGIRSTFYRIAMITGQGFLIMLAGFFETSTGLPPIEITAMAGPSFAKEIVLPEVPQNAETTNGESYFAVFPQKAELSTQNIPTYQLDSIRKVVSTYNLENGFVLNQIALAKEVSWWSKHVSIPLKEFLKKYFGVKKPVIDGKTPTGNVSVVAVKLSSKPEKNEELVMNFDFKRGDKSLRLLEGERLMFNATNFEKPAYLLFQCDQKLTRPSEAVFKGISGNLHLAWSMTFIILVAMFIMFSVYHRLILPHPASDKQFAERQNLFKEFFKTFSSFFRRKDIGLIISFLLLYRLGESQIVKMAPLFMLDSRQLGGLGLTTGQVALIYGTFGILALTTGGILGGLAAAKKGLKYWIWVMALTINIPHLVYVYMSYFQPENQWIIGLCVVIEQFSYGFGFTAYMLYMIYIADGEHKTAHFAIATGFMALGMMLPGMFSGWLQDLIGYQHFFVWVMLCMIPGLIPVFFVKIAPEFGIKKKTD